MAFQVSVTHWFLLTPFCHRAVVLSRGRRESSQRRKGRRWSGAEGRKEEHGGCGGLGMGVRTGEWDPGVRGWSW